MRGAALNMFCLLRTKLIDGEHEQQPRSHDVFFIRTEGVIKLRNDWRLLHSSILRDIDNNPIVPLGIANTPIGNKDVTLNIIIILVRIGSA